MPPPWGCGLGGGFGSGILYDVDFTQLATGGISAAALLAQFANLNFARAAAYLAADPTAPMSSWSETVQTSDQTVVTSGLTLNVARIGQRTSSSSSRGLVIEEKRENNFQMNRSLSTVGGYLNAGSVAGVSTSYPAPDGTTSANANRFILASGQFSVYQSLANQVPAPTVTAWVRSGQVSGSTNWQISAGDGSTENAIGGSIGQAWTRETLFGVFVALSGSAVPVDGRSWSGGPAAGARDAVIDLVQVEGAGNESPSNTYATEVILTEGAVNSLGHHSQLGNTVVRSPERAWHDTPGNLISNGRLSWYVKFIPKGSSSQYNRNYATFKARILTFDANNYLEWDASTNRLNMVVAGASWSPVGTLTFNAFDTVEIMAQMGSSTLNSSLKFKVNGTLTDLGNSGAPQGALGTFSAMDIMCSRFNDPNAPAVSVPSSQQFTSWLQRITGYPYGQAAF